MTITLRQAVEILRKGGIVGYPTETLYGLGARIDNPAAVERLKKLKGRDGKKPLLLGLSSVSSIPKYARVGGRQLAFLRRILPGPVAVLLEKKPTVPDSITGGGPLVGIRVPANRTARKLAEPFGAITSTSANPAGKPPATTAEQVERELGIFSVVPGTCKYRAPSTLLNLATGEIPRKGAYPSGKLEKLWREHFGGNGEK